MFAVFRQGLLSLARVAAGLMVCLLMGLSLPARATDWQDSPALAALFQQAGVTGSFVLYDPQADRFTGYNRPRAETRFVPASTFKIVNSLIGLTTGAVASVDQVLPYTGPTPAPFPGWDKDMGLREAIRVSNVPIYQALARRIGLADMGEILTRLDYGNGLTGPHVDRFWLDGPLAISALEQTRFLARLARGTLPLPAEVQAAVGDISRLEQRDGSSLYGKTGWQNAPGLGVGWWVGWVEAEGRIHAFALNMDMAGAQDAPRRVELGRASLAALGIY